MSKPLLEIKNLHIGYPVWGGVLRHKVGEVRAVDGVSLTLNQGETLGLVGESGCGKTTIAKAVINILKATIMKKMFVNAKKIRAEVSLCPNSLNESAVISVTGSARVYSVGCQGMCRVPSLR